MRSSTASSASSTDGSEIRIIARQSGQHAVIQVTNQGTLLANTGSTRVGMGNARKRLQLAKGEQSSLDLSEDDGWIQGNLALSAHRLTYTNMEPSQKPLLGPGSTGTGCCKDSAGVLSPPSSCWSTDRSWKNQAQS
ncbi:hypothetical protein [Massilia eburnea]|uniref:hypothetical protein n=1 Tax=Massilia eburnea TaxID=1776165 RepID=UPI003D6A5E53